MAGLLVHAAGVAVAVTIALGFAISHAQTADQLACGLEPGPSRTVVEAVDGDTLRLDDGKILRLLAVLAPKPHDAGATTSPWPAAIAAKTALESEVGGKTISLAFSGPRTDRYDRVLAHAFVEHGKETRWLQHRLIETGSARVFSGSGLDSCAEKLLPVERQARSSGRGLWSSAAYQMRPADRPTELKRYAGTFQVITGTIQRVAPSRNVILIDLESSEAPRKADDNAVTGALRLVIPRDPSAAATGKPRMQAGAIVEARGWIAARYRPEIALVSPSDIELISSPSADAEETATAKQSKRTSRKQRRPEAEPPGGEKQ